MAQTGGEERQNQTRLVAVSGSVLIDSGVYKRIIVDSGVDVRETEYHSGYWYW